MPRLCESSILHCGKLFQLLGSTLPQQSGESCTKMKQILGENLVSNNYLWASLSTTFSKEEETAAQV
jgi:hypothetical protein